MPNIFALGTGHAHASVVFEVRCSINDKLKKNHKAYENAITLIMINGTLHIIVSSQSVKPGPWTGLDWATCDIETRNPVRVLDFFPFYSFFSCGIECNQIQMSNQLLFETFP